MAWPRIVVVAFAIVSALKVEQVLASDSTSAQGQIEQLERFIQDHPGVFDWRVHNQLRHLYINETPPDLRMAMRHCDAILQHSPMDDYILHILSGWQIDKDNSTARANLLMNAQSFPDLRFCFLKVGDLYAMDGNVRMAKSAYLKVAADKSYSMKRYHLLAEDRLTLLEEEPGRATAAAIVGSYRGTANIAMQGGQRNIPVILDIKPEVRRGFTGSLTIEGSHVVVPIHGTYDRGNITAAGSLPDRSISVSMQAKGSGKFITGTYKLVMSNYRQFYLESRVSSGDFSVSR